MQHIISEVEDIPPAPPLVERRRTPGRRQAWRGGRRDSDWLERPYGALARLEKTQKMPARVLRALTSMHLW